MTIKKTELEKRKGMAIANAQKLGGNRFGPASAPPADRRAQRERDRAAGLVPFAVKLPAALVQQLNETAQQRGVALNDLVAELLRAQLAR
jgi:DNA-binding Xre family transcriptional regulator